MSTIFKHDNGSASIVDICAGNANAPDGYNHPINYLLDMSINGLARFILTCPKKDCMDGLNALYRGVGFRNFWHPGVFADRWDATTLDDEKDYDLYRDLILDRHSDFCRSIRVETGYSSPHANFEVLSPSQGLISMDGLDTNDAAIVLLAKSTSGQKIVVAGDVGRRTFLEMATNSTVRAKLDNIDILVVRDNAALAKSIDIIKDVLRPKIIVYGLAGADIIRSSLLNDVFQVNVKDFGTVVIDDNSGRFSVYVSETHKFCCNKYNGDGRRHPIYAVTNIINL